MSAMTSPWVVHPFLIGLFPVLFLYAHNASEISRIELIVPSLVILSLTIFAWVILSRLLRSPQKAGLIISLFLVLFFSTSHTLMLLNDSLTSLSNLWVHRDVNLDQRLILFVEVVLFAALVRLIVRKIENPRPLTRVLNIFSIVLISLPLGNLAFGARQAADSTTQARRSLAGEPNQITVDTVALAPRKPDIYYIILDGYARGDVMKNIYGFDIEPFLKRLESLGFYVARDSRSNYPQTRLSLASALNCRYLDPSDAGSQEMSEAMWGLIGDNTVLKALRKHGYKFVTFSTGLGETEHPEADVYLSPNLPLTGFQWMLVSSTPLASVLMAPSTINPYQLSRKRTLHVLDKLPEIAKMPAPTFTFAHILSPHPPFTFGEHGEDVSPYRKVYRLTDGEWYRFYYGNDRKRYIDSYRKQSMFITARVEQAIRGILANSSEPPIIILQSDHGSGMGLHTNSLENTDLDERMSILNAYYLPDGGNSALYETITPVNSFRIVLNKYFGAHLELLDDRSFYSTWPQPLNFTDVTKRLRVGKDHVPPKTEPPRGHETTSPNL
jgi:Sulfatase